MTRVGTVAAFLVLGSSTLAHAQASRAAFRADSGVVVRFHLPSGRVEAGKLLAPFAADSAVWRFCHYPAPACQPGGVGYGELLRPDVSALDLHRGTRAGTGALIGGSIGAVITVLALTSSNPEIGTGGALVLGLSLAAFTTGGGAVLGGMFHVWQPVSDTGTR